MATASSAPSMVGSLMAKAASVSAFHTQISLYVQCMDLIMYKYMAKVSWVCAHGFGVLSAALLCYPYHAPPPPPPPPPLPPPHLSVHALSYNMLLCQLPCVVFLQNNVKLKRHVAISCLLGRLDGASQYTSFMLHLVPSGRGTKLPAIAHLLCFV